MRCIERPALRPAPRATWAALAVSLAASWMAGCSGKPPSVPPPASAPAPAPVPATTSPPGPASPSAESAGAGAAAPNAARTTGTPGGARGATGGAAVAGRAGPATSWAAYKRQAAQRLVQATPQGSYTGPVPEPLLAIPVLEIELNADGSVRRIEVLRRPTQAQDTVQLAIDAVRRAAPFGDASRLPRPWRFTEAFLFDDARRFKPRTLDE